MAQTNVQAFSGDVAISSNLAVDTNTLFVDSVGNKVGIGTTNPVEKFHLYGSPIIQHSLTNSSVTNDSWHIVGTWDATGPDAVQKGGNLHLTFLGGALFGSNPVGKSEILARVGNQSAHRSILWKVEGEKIFTDVRMRRVGDVAYKYDICVKMRHFTHHTMRTECSRTTSFERRFTSTTEPSSADTTNVELGTTLPSTDKYGNLGIGTTSPGSALDVVGNLNVDGVITTPQRPVFYAYKAGGASLADGAGGTVPFGNTRIDVGGCYDTSTYKFTAPTTGYYWFEMTVLLRYGNADGSCEITLYKNGVNVADRHLAFASCLGSGDHDNLSFSVPIHMNVDDEVNAHVGSISAGVNIYYGEDLGHFSGYFIG